MMATPVSSGALSITDSGKVIPVQIQISSSTGFLGGKSPEVLHLPPVAPASIYRMRGRECPRKLGVSARGRGNNGRLREVSA